MFSQVRVRPPGGGGTSVPGSFPSLWSQVLSWGGGGGEYPSPGQWVPPFLELQMDNITKQCELGGHLKGANFENVFGHDDSQPQMKIATKRFNYSQQSVHVECDKTKRDH